MDYKQKFFKQLNSTNVYAKQNLAELEDRTVIFAEQQTDGHGRFDRVWISDKVGNLYASIVLKPKNFSADLPLANLTQYLSVVLSELLEEYGVVADIKWPNDVLVGGKKISGILAETSFCGNGFNGFVLGIGVNLNLSKEDVSLINQPATALNLELNKKIDLKEFSDKLFNNFFEEYDLFMQKGFEFIKRRYLPRCSFIGKDVSVVNMDEKKYGIARQINDDGSLLIDLPKENRHEIVRIGDLTCLKMN